MSEIATTVGHGCATARQSRLVAAMRKGSVRLVVPLSVMSITLPLPVALDVVEPQPTTTSHPEANAGGPSSARTYVIKTLGCQMNVHDSEHMAGMLEQAGYVPAGPAEAAAEDADVIVINTCAVRENAADKL